MITTIIRGRDLENQKPRTLVYGYDVERMTLHVYLWTDRRIHACLYDGPGSQPQTTTWHRDEDHERWGHIYDNLKRAYIDTCDEPYTWKLAGSGIFLSYTSSARTRQPSQFYGRVFGSARERLAAEIDEASTNPTIPEAK